MHDSYRKLLKSITAKSGDIGLKQSYRLLENVCDDHVGVSTYRVEHEDTEGCGTIRAQNGIVQEWKVSIWKFLSRLKGSSMRKDHRRPTPALPSSEC